MKPETLIKRIGGISETARQIGVSRQAVHLWIVRGKIPADRVPALAKAAGVQLWQVDRRFRDMIVLDQDYKAQHNEQ